MLSAKHTLKPVEPPKPPATNLSGQWDVDIQYTAGKTTHTLHLRQQENGWRARIRVISWRATSPGTISGDTITLASVVTERHGDALTYRFTGRLSPQRRSGEASETLSGDARHGQ